MEEAKKSLGKLLLDLPEGRYSVVDIVHDWVEVLKKADEGRDLNGSELVKKALEDIISGRVTLKDIKAAKAKGAAPQESEKKEEKAEAKEDKEEKAEKAKKNGKSKK